MDEGAHFYRCDLQVHTPRDINWTGIERVEDAARNAYAAKLVQACRQRGLQAIAITDHHDMAFVPYVIRAALEETDDHGKGLPKEQQLIVFPGMELTLGVPCQALLIFDADFPEDLYALAMTSLAISPNPPDHPKTADTQRLNRIQSLPQLKEELDKHTYLKGRYIIFPNVGRDRQFSLIRKGLAGKYLEMPCVGGYVDGELSELGDGALTIIAGKSMEWGNKRIGCFQTSDNRHEDHRDLGMSTTWIKWAVPTAEALRQACLGQESRISQEQPRLPCVVIGSISVSNSVFLGPIDLEFNPQYTALIGGRGTGKSTILEYLRWGLCDQPPGGGDEDTPNFHLRRARLIDDTLKPVSATIQVTFHINGVQHVVRRNSVDGSILIKIGTDDMRPCTEDEVRSLLPIQAYSQKQLSDVSVRIDELLRFLTAPIRSELARLDRRADELAEHIRQNYATRRRQHTLTQALQQSELEQKSLTAQVEALRSGLTGLSEEDRRLLENGKTFETADFAVQSWRDGAHSFRESAVALRTILDTQLAQAMPPPNEPEKGILDAAYGEYLALLNNAQAALAPLIERAEILDGPIAAMAPTSPWHQWSEKLALFKQMYDAAVLRSSTHSDKMKQLQTVEERLSNHGRTIARIREELRSLSAAEAAYQSQRDAWQALLKERDDLLETQCKILTENSGGSIRAHVKRFADATDFINSLRQALTGSRFQTGKLDKLGELITQAGDDGLAHWNSLVLDLESLAEVDVDREGADRKPETPALTSAGFAPTDCDRIMRSLEPEKWLNLSLIPIRSQPVFEYRAREYDYIPFRNASAGQQATALLKTLLNQVGSPLIIDQPEEDLDNPVMLEIVEQIWHAKQNRQLIFASHNANLVVNGDAELVAWCDYRAAGDQSRGTIVGKGAIDVPLVRNAIKAIMEGGEAAFNLRKEKYGF